IYVKIGLLLAALSIPATYLVLAPHSAVIPGFELGATGLALKMVVLQIFGANLQAIWLGRNNQWSYQWAYQVILAGLFLSLAWLLKAASLKALTVMGFGQATLAASIAGGVLYAPTALWIIWRIPQLAGLHSDDLLRIRNDVAQF